jgi:hypothetical protein
MIDKIADILDSIADSLESQGLINEAYDLDMVSNSLLKNAAQEIEQTVSVANMSKAIESIPIHVKSPISNIGNIVQKLLQLNSRSPRVAMNALIELAVGKNGSVDQIFANAGLLNAAINAVNSKAKSVPGTRNPTQQKEAVDQNTGMPSIQPKYGFEIFVAFTAFFEPPPTTKQKVVRCITRLNNSLPKEIPPSGRAPEQPVQTPI